MQKITIQPLTKQAFAPFGDILEVENAASSFWINNDKCHRHHDLAKVETTGENPRTLINIFAGQPYALPLQLDMVERHPFGSQAFMPLSDRPFLVIVAPDTEDGPGEPLAFMTKPGQGVNYHRNVWHGVLTPLEEPANFLVVDRGGDGNNLEEFFYKAPFIIA